MEELYDFKIAFILYIYWLYIKSPTGKTNSSAYTTTLYYYKMVKCSGAMQIVMKLDKLFLGWLVRTLFSAYDLYYLKYIIQLSIGRTKRPFQSGLLKSGQSWMPSQFLLEDCGLLLVCRKHNNSTWFTEGKLDFIKSRKRNPIFIALLSLLFNFFFNSSFLLVTQLPCELFRSWFGCVNLSLGQI